MTSFSQFLQTFVPALEKKSTQLNKASWILETTGLDDACDLKAALDTELRMLFQDKETYEKLLSWSVDDPILKRQQNVLIRAFKQNQVEKSLLEELATKEAHIAQSFAGFRPILDGKSCSENDIRDILKKEENVQLRKSAWEASKEIGKVLAPQILALVDLRNKIARSLGYSDYFQMQLDLQEVDGAWLLETFDTLAKGSDAAYSTVIEEIEKRQKEPGPWSWIEPFCQEDPLDTKELDTLVEGVDITQAATEFFKKMGFDVRDILAKSDMEERLGKNQHAFCINIDRKKDVRTLNNVKPTLKWLETVLHELGHAVYELGFNEKLPWLLREPPHMIPTEAMALLAGRQAYRPASLKELVGKKDELLFKKAESSLKRRQLIFSRWVLVMTAFESELYKNPHQDLNGLWWHLVQKYQKITPPQGREGKFDWATKYHIGLAPVYYFSYLVGEMLASSIQEALSTKTLAEPTAGAFLTKKLFFPGNSLPWNKLAEEVTGGPLTPDGWLKEFA